MTRYSHPAILFGCVLIAGVVSGFAAWLSLTFPQLKSKLASELDPSNPNYKTVMCGPRSLSVALGRLGVSISQSEIASKCKVTPHGVALTDLELVADNLRTIRAAATNIGWEDLRSLDGVAVLFVKGDHYIAADPRERSSEVSERNSIRVYDQEVPARWYSRSLLEDIWSGEALVISKMPSAPVIRSDACLAWDECYIDKGVLAGSSDVTYKFTLRNIGAKTLYIDSIETSCGCVKNRLSTKQVSPGESAWIEVDVSLDGRQGYIYQYLIVSTNDPKNPKSFLQMACGVPKKWPVSREAIRLEDLPQGGIVRQNFVVADSGFAGVKIHSAKFFPRGSPGSVDDPSCSIDWKVIGDDSKMVSHRTGFSASPGDYLVQISFDASNSCPIGPFEGDVVVTVEADGSFTTHKIDVQGLVVHDVHAVPRMGLITLGPNSNGVGSTAIRLHSKSNRNIAVVKVWADGINSLEIEPEKGFQAGENRYVVTARMPDTAASTAPINGTAMFELDSGIVIPVPVTVYRPPAKGGGRLPMDSGNE